MWFSAVQNLVFVCVQAAGGEELLKLLKLHVPDIARVDPFARFAIRPDVVKASKIPGDAQIVLPVRHPWERLVAYFKQCEEIGPISGRGWIWEDSIDGLIQFLASTVESAYQTPDVVGDSGRAVASEQILFTTPNSREGELVHRMRSQAYFFQQLATAFPGRTPELIRFETFEDDIRKIPALRTIKKVPAVRGAKSTAEDLWTVDREIAFRMFAGSDYTVGGYGVYGE